jgi:hypothetical protein
MKCSLKMRQKFAAHLKTFSKALGKQVQLINAEVIGRARVPVLKATLVVPLGVGCGEGRA